MTALNGYIQGLGSSRTVRKTGKNIKLFVYDNIDRVIVFNEAGETTQKTLTGKNLCSVNSVSVQNVTAIYNDYNPILRNISFSDNTQYTFSCNIITDDTTHQFGIKVYYKDGTTSYLAFHDGNIDKTNVTTASEKSIDYIAFFYDVNFQIGFSDLQIETGSTATEFEPYCGGIPSPNPDYPQDIKGIGLKQSDGTYSVSIDYDDDNGRTGTITASGLAYPLYEGDVLDFVNGKVIRANGYKVFDGTEAWGDYPSYNGYYMTISDMKTGSRMDGKSNCFLTSFTAGHIDNTIWYGVLNNNIYLIEINISGVTDLASWKTWLSNNPTYIVYPLATPTDEYITLSGDISDIGTATVTADGTLTVQYDKVEMAIRKYSPKPDWSKIGYSDTPTEIISAFDYARDIQKTWTASSPNFNGDKKLFYFPDIDISGKNRGLNGFFQNSNLMHVEPLTIGEATPTGTVNCQGMYQNTWVEDVTMTAKTNTQKFNFNDCFSGCINLKKVTLNMKADSATGMFYDCRSFTGNLTGLDTSEVTNFSNMFENCINLTLMPPIDTSSATSMYRMFGACEKLQTMEIATYNYSHVQDFAQMFWQCTAIKNLPWINFSAATNLTNMFQATGSNLTEQSRDNLLRSLTSAIAYTGTKTLSQLGFTNSMYSAASWQALQHYTDFVNAGWSIGYT